jgi:hypothetical protein
VSFKKDSNPDPISEKMETLRSKHDQLYDKLFANSSKSPSNASEKSEI